MYFVDESLAGIDVKLTYIEYWNEFQTAMGKDWPKYNAQICFGNGHTFQLQLKD